MFVYAGEEPRDQAGVPPLYEAGLQVLEKKKKKSSIGSHINIDMIVGTSPATATAAMLAFPPRRAARAARRSKSSGS